MKCMYLSTLPLSFSLPSLPFLHPHTYTHNPFVNKQTTTLSLPIPPSLRYAYAQTYIYLCTCCSYLTLYLTPVRILTHVLIHQYTIHHTYKTQTSHSTPHNWPGVAISLLTYILRVIKSSTLNVHPRPMPQVQPAYHSIIISSESCSIHYLLSTIYIYQQQQLLLLDTPTAVE